MCVNLRVDGLVRFEIERHLLFFALVCENGPDEQDEAIGRNSVVELQPLLSTCDCGKHRESINARLDVGCGSVLLRQHGGRTGYLILEATDQPRIHWQVDPNAPLAAK